MSYFTWHFNRLCNFEPNYSNKINYDFYDLECYNHSTIINVQYMYLVYTEQKIKLLKKMIKNGLSFMYFSAAAET